MKDENRTLKIYPNPVNKGSELQVEIPSVMNFERLILINSKGQVLRTKDSLREEAIRINMASYPAGVYYILLRGSDKNEYHKIVVVD